MLNVDSERMFYMFSTQTLARWTQAAIGIMIYDRNHGLMNVPDNIDFRGSILRFRTLRFYESKLHALTTAIAICLKE